MLISPLLGKTEIQRDYVTFLRLQVIFKLPLCPHTPGRWVCQPDCITYTTPQNSMPFPEPCGLTLLMFLSWQKCILSNSCSLLVTQFKPDLSVKLLLFKNYLFIWLCRVLAVACKIFSCGIQTLRDSCPLHWECLSHWTTREVLYETSDFLLQNSLPQPQLHSVQIPSRTLITWIY